MSWGDSLVQGHLQDLLLAPGFLNAVPHLGQEVLQVAQELWLILPKLGPELPDLPPAEREVFGSKHPPMPCQFWRLISFSPCCWGHVVLTVAMILSPAPAPGKEVLAACRGTKLGENPSLFQPQAALPHPAGHP